MLFMTNPNVQVIQCLDEVCDVVCTLGLSSLFCLLYEKEEKEDLPSIDKELNMAARARAILQRERKRWLIHSFWCG